MPTYTFACSHNHEVEIQRSIVDGPPEEVICEECGEVMERVWMVNEDVPRMVMDPWDTMYRTIIEPQYAEWRHRENKKRSK